LRAAQVGGIVSVADNTSYNLSRYGVDSMKKTGVSRRTALKTLGTGAGAVTLLPFLSDEGLLAFSGIQRSGAKPALKALTAPQYATLEVLVDAIIPTDERSPGAKEARVADYIDLLLSEADDELKQKWNDGLAAVDAEATTRFSAPVVKLTPSQVDTLLTEISKNERKPQTPAERRSTATTRPRSASTRTCATKAISFCRSSTAVSRKTARTVRTAARRPSPRPEAARRCSQPACHQSRSC
jgi:hypothetical protein